MERTQYKRKFFLSYRMKGDRLKLQAKSKILQTSKFLRNDENCWKKKFSVAETKGEPASIFVHLMFAQNIDAITFFSILIVKFNSKKIRIFSILEKKQKIQEEIVFLKNWLTLSEKHLQQNWRAEYTPVLASRLIKLPSDFISVQTKIRSTQVKLNNLKTTNYGNIGIDSNQKHA